MTKNRQKEEIGLLTGFFSSLNRISQQEYINVERKFLKKCTQVFIVLFLGV
jgi:hypothetical protein